ncbi:hypothetical protein CU669_19345 [Paramagnetospirillum kuznetsovii]|uniref:Nucleoside 2-deoxyribosyltransferase n=1 Tax=Paramagnetospirillum kuznetsovii TaxID=2053833 RepID=A0A364NT54_9PROT|nr:hypothetical protein [Paramagnetospirillum kuznetsovii]RAU20263.1 hypothetical protein CU669_19345 [Paramagnetospirillum kuznetsovii]
MTSFTDITILHAWRFDDLFTEMEGMLHSVPGFEYRNFGLPWHDPAYQPSTEEGLEYLRNRAEVQVLPAQVAIAIPELFASDRGRQWAEIELNVCATENKPVLVATKDPSKIPDWLATRATKTVAWDASAVVAAVRRLAGHPVD